MRQPQCGSLNKVTLMTESQLGRITKSASTQEPQCAILNMAALMRQPH